MILRPRQEVFVERCLAALHGRGNTLGVAPTGCHAPGTPVLMFDGTIKPVEEVVVGDRLMGPDSRPRTVLALHRGEDEMYEIRPLKGEPFVVNAGHVLSLVKTEEGRKGSHRWSAPGGTIANISVAAYLRSSGTFKHLYKLYRVPVDFPTKDQPELDPYFLGLLLGDGSLTHGTPAITTADPEVAQVCQEMADRLGLALRIDQLRGNEANTCYFANPTRTENGLANVLRHFGLKGCGAGGKFIPQHYKTGSRQTRRAVLAGLIDTDGYLTRNAIEFSTASPRLAEDVAFVARSLGFAAFPRPKRVDGRTYHRFTISGDFAKLPLRMARCIPGERKKKNPLRVGFTVHPVGRGPYFGFTVDGDHLYLLGDFTVTHNSGKTLMLSAVAGRLIAGTDAKALVLAHRDELTAQNRDKFARINPTLDSSVVDAGGKDWAGRAVFAMVQTLSRQANLAAMPALDVLVVDEAHHAVAASCRRVIDRARERNPDLKLLDVTATPSRGDGKDLREVFDNCADQIRLGELVASGHLVPPRTFVVDVGIREDLSRVRRTVDDFDMGEVAQVMDRAPVTEQVVRHWKEKAGERRTVVFCSTVAHAEHVSEAFRAQGVAAETVTGETPAGARADILARLDSGETQVLVNVAVATEGFDCQPVSCVMLLRPCSHKSTMIQMIGRGLRPVDPELYPGVVKTDCLVLDFGTSVLTHGSLEQDVDLDDRLREEEGETPTKTCPECTAEVHLSVRECPFCDHLFEREGKPELESFAMTEIELLDRSPFRWVDLFGDDGALLAAGFDAWAGAFLWDGLWHAVGGGRDLPFRRLAIGDRAMAIASADDWLNANETTDAASKAKRWLREPATAKTMWRAVIHVALLDAVGLSPSAPSEVERRRVRDEARDWFRRGGRLSPPGPARPPMADELLEMAGEAVGRVLEGKDITRPIHTLTFAELMEIADAVLKAWQRFMGCTDDVDIPFDPRVTPGAGSPGAGR